VISRVISSVVGPRPPVTRMISARVSASASAFADFLAIGDGDLAGDPQAKREKLLAEEGEMGVDRIAEQQLGPGVDDFNDHRKAV
jgi:hypothetical protein